MSKKMSDTRTSIQEIKETVQEFRRARGWGGEVKDGAISLVLEASELLELFQWQPSEVVRDNERYKEAVADELSDVLWWVAVISDELDIDMAAAFEKKLKKHAEKYPLNKFSADLPQEERRKNYYQVKARTRGGHPLAETEED